MKVKNTPLAMNGDEVALLAMSRLRGSGRLSDKNVDCFIDGYKACQDALQNPQKLIPILQHHLGKFSKVRQDIDDYIGYADLRRGHTDEETEKIKYAEEIAEAIKPLIELLQKKIEK